MENLLFILALAGIVLGGYSLFAPSLRRRGWNLPFMHLFDEEEDEDDVGADDLDQPLDKAFAARQAKAKEPKAQKEPKAPKAPKIKKKRGKDIDTLAFTPALEMAPLSSMPRSSRRPAMDGDEEEIDPRIVIERPNADKDPEIELDPELQALVDSVAEVNPDEAVAVGAGAVEATSAATSMPIDPAAVPAEAKKPDNFGDNMLDLFGDDEIEDTKPAALREALEPCTIDQLREEAASMRAILTSLGQTTGQHAA